MIPEKFLSKREFSIIIKIREDENIRINHQSHYYSSVHPQGVSIHSRRLIGQDESDY